MPFYDSRSDTCEYFVDFVNKVDNIFGNIIE